MKCRILVWGWNCQSLCYASAFQNGPKFLCLDWFLHCLHQWLKMQGLHSLQPGMPERPILRSCRKFSSLFSENTMCQFLEEKQTLFRCFLYWTSFWVAFIFARKQWSFGTAKLAKLSSGTDLKGRGAFEDSQIDRSTAKCSRGTEICIQLFRSLFNLLYHLTCTYSRNVTALAIPSLRMKKQMLEKVTGDAVKSRIILRGT